MTVDDNPRALNSNPNHVHAVVVQVPWAFVVVDSEHWVLKSYNEAMKRPELWVKPMENEYGTLMDKGCWELVELP